MKNKILSGSMLAFALLTGTAQAQLKVPAPSPVCTIKQNFALSDITIEYSRPSAKGRTIFGDLVPYDKMWRTGANASTKITFGEDVKLEGNLVPAGTYSFYTIPGKTEWTVVINKNTTNWGVDGYKQEEDVVRFKVKPTSVMAPVETFTMNIADLTTNSARIELSWEKTRVSVNVTADIDAKIMKSIETALAPADKRPYFQAANYYYENDKDMVKALEWANKAMELNPDAFWIVHLKAKIQLKQKDYKGAIASAEKSMEMAKKDGHADYVALNEKLIAEAKKGK
jgi:hypothetical protein